MAEHSISIRLGLDGASKVVKSLNDAGVNGSKALDRISAASKPASKWMLALSAATGDVRGRIEGLSARLGSLAPVMGALGPAGTVVGAGLGAVVVGALGAVAALRRVIDVTRTATEEFDGLDDQASQLGVTAERFQSLAFGGLQIGVSTEETTKALIKLNDNLGSVLLKGGKVTKETALAFSSLGLSRKEVKDSQGDLEKLLPKMADGFAKLKTQAERTAVAQNLFGKQGARLLPLLNLGASGLDEFSVAARESGAVLKGEYVSTLSETGDRLAALSRVVHVQMGIVGALFSPVLLQLERFKTSVWQAFAGWVERSGIAQRVIDGMNRIADAVKKMVDDAGGVDAVFDLITTKLEGLVAGLPGATKDFRELADSIMTVARAINFLTTPVGELFKNFTDKADSVVNRLAQKLTPAAPKEMFGPSLPGGFGTKSPAGGIGSDRLLVAPAVKSALPAQSQMVGVGGSVDINVRGPADARRVKTRNPGVPLNVNQGLSLGLP